MSCSFRNMWSFIVLALVCSFANGSLRAAADDATPAKTAATSPKDADAATGDKTKYDLRYKCAIGDVWRYEVAHKASIRTTIDETTQAAQTRTDSVKSFKITDVLADGSIEFMTVVEKVHMINQLPDSAASEYDSARDTTPPPGFDDAAKSVGVPLSVVRMAPNGKVLRRDIKVKRPGNEDEGPLMLLLPQQPAAIGDTWDEPFDIAVTLKTGGTKGIQTRRHYKLTKVENGIATISVAYQVLSPIDAHIESQLVQRLMDVEARFDIDAGRVVSQKMDIDKKILGFAGPTSSMQYVVRMEEKLLFAPHKITVKPAEKPTTRVAETPKPATQTPAAETPAAGPSLSPASPTRTATRPTTKEAGTPQRR